MPFPPQFEPAVRPRPDPVVEPDWRDHEIRELRAALCRHAPAPDDAYWTEDATWIGCVDVALDKSVGPGDFIRMTIKVTTRDDTNDVWEFYRANQAQITSAIRSKVPGGNVRIVDLQIEKGSVTIIVLAQITIGLIAIAVAILGNYDNIERNFKRAMPLLKQYVIDVTNSLKGLFRSFGLGFV